MRIRSAAIPMKKLIPYIIILLFAFPVQSKAQQKFPQHAFRSPVDFPLYLSGTFGEIRSGHLHAGIDIKTGGVQGKKVYAVADGYISRIGITLGGYGKALYITHPNGYVSVYGHLEKFSPRIQRYVKAIQYRRKRFTVQIFPPKDSLRVKKGEIIAYTGNTGGSLGPHLHFEIRDARTQHPINPLLFGSIRVKDTEPPLIAQLLVYPVFPYSRINGRHDTLVLPVAGHGKNCFLKNIPVIDATGPVAFGLRTFDAMNGIRNKNGIYSLKLYRDTLPVFVLKTDSIAFKNTRYVNSLVDYHYLEKTGKQVIRTQLDTNNRLGIYHKVFHHGIFIFKDTVTHRFTFVVKDIYGNTSLLKFSVKDSPVRTKTTRHHQQPEGDFIRFDRPAKIKSGDLALFFPKNCFYRSLRLRVATRPAEKTTLSPVYAIHNRFVPVQKYFTLSIRDDSVPAKLKDKTYIAYAPDATESFGYAGGTWQNNRIISKVRALGLYTLMADTMAPEIRPLNFGQGTKVTGKKFLLLKIKDAESGIKSYEGTLNGHWILLEYDAKTGKLTYTFDQYLKKGKNLFRLDVIDHVGNRNYYTATIYR